MTYKKALEEKEHHDKRYVRYDGTTYAVGISLYSNGSFWLNIYLRGDAPRFSPNLYIREGLRYNPEYVLIETVSYGALNVEDAMLFCRQMEEAVSTAKFIQNAFIQPLRDGTFAFGDVVSA